MEDKFYTVDQIARILEMHPKTIRRFIREGKLRANKVGKQWRVSGHDLSLFVEGNKIPTKTESDKTYCIDSDSPVQKINVSAVVDISDVSKEESIRISNTLIAVMNCKDSKLGKSTVNVQFFEDENKLRVVLWGSLMIVETMLNTISLLTNQTDN